MSDFVDRVGQYCKQGEESCNCAGVEAPCTFGCHESGYAILGGERVPITPNVLRKLAEESPGEPLKFQGIQYGGQMRTFDSGATRDTDEGKLDYEGFLSPLVLRRYAEYMHKHRYQADGALRASDNWQKGIPLDQYMKSAWRHHMEWWTEHRDLVLSEGMDDVGPLEEALCAVIFNASGYLHELLKDE